MGRWYFGYVDGISCVVGTLDMSMVVSCVVGTLVMSMVISCVVGTLDMSMVVSCVVGTLVMSMVISCVVGTLDMSMVVSCVVVARHGVHVTSIPDRDGMYIEEVYVTCVMGRDWRGRFDLDMRRNAFEKKGNLAPRYIGPFKILKRISLVAYRLRLPEELSSMHDTFHVSNMKKCLADANLHVSLDEIKVDKTLRFIKEPVENMDREIKKLKCRKIVIVKVTWNVKLGPEFNWEHEDQMRIKLMDTMGVRENKNDMIVDGSHFVLCLVRAKLENFQCKARPCNELMGIIKEGFHGTEVSARVLCVFMVMVDGLDHGQGISWRLSYSWFSCLADVPVGYGWHYGLLWFPCQKGNVKGKIKVAYKKGLHTRKETTDEVSDPVKLNECKIASPTIVPYNELYRGIAGPASQAALGAGIPNTVVSTTINKVCASWMKDAQPITKGSKFGQDTLVDGMVKDGLWDAFNDFKMGNCGEICVDMRQGLDMDVGNNDDYGDWMTRWDKLCERNYYYNSRTQESTWEPPPVMENLAFCGYVSHDSKDNSNSVDGKMDSKEENSNFLQHVAVSDGLSSDVSPEKIHNEHLGLLSLS
uniref:Putative reverse transcriptase domain-containing protein n=1 Tax=Tanacetum cinerariifolium TaxID=118510 RepID=A0A6L2KRU6_TANCI|nr:putative reverse transcriptase domain-containing protein [Tanacetum cinerariifolium]